MTSTEATANQAPANSVSTVGVKGGSSVTAWRSLSDYFTQQHRLFEDIDLAALVEPRRIQAPPGYHSSKCVSAGLFTLLSNRVLRQAAGIGQVPTEILADMP
jgi:hypothetical protein